MEQVNLTDGATATFVDKCDSTVTVCPDGVELQNRSISVGDQVGGMKIGAIKCQYYSKDIPGWPGGPEFTARKDKWNCTASADKNAAENNVTENGTRLHPWVSVVGTDL